jgi:hypothetical protein
MGTALPVPDMWCLRLELLPWMSANVSGSIVVW